MRLAYLMRRPLSCVATGLRRQRTPLADRSVDHVSEVGLIHCDLEAGQLRVDGGVGLDRHGRLAWQLPSGYVPRIAWLPTTARSVTPAIDEAARSRCSSCSRLTPTRHHVEAIDRRKRGGALLLAQEAGGVAEVELHLGIQRTFAPVASRLQLRARFLIGATHSPRPRQHGAEHFNPQERFHLATRRNRTPNPTADRANNTDTGNSNNAAPRPPSTAARHRRSSVRSQPQLLVLLRGLSPGRAGDESS